MRNCICFPGSDQKGMVIEGREGGRSNGEGERKWEGRKGKRGSLALAAGRGSMPLASPSYRLTLISTGPCAAGMS